MYLNVTPVSNVNEYTMRIFARGRHQILDFPLKEREREVERRDLSPICPFFCHFKLNRIGFFSQEGDMKKCAKGISHGCYERQNFGEGEK